MTVNACFRQLISAIDFSALAARFFEVLLEKRVFIRHVLFDSHTTHYSTQHVGANGAILFFGCGTNLLRLIYGQVDQQGRSLGILHPVDDTLQYYLISIS